MMLWSDNVSLLAGYGGLDYSIVTTTKTDYVPSPPIKYNSFKLVQEFRRFYRYIYT
jgi:hypothetical protein